jgi:adenylate cyclase
MSTLIQKHRGRVVDSPGDNLLAEFTSVVDAVRCAVEIQEELRVRNAELPENRRMHFRIGINLGDVVQEGERIYGDGVNITARVEGLAEGGGICISGTVYDSIKNKLSLSYESLGEHTVKNITEPVRVYRMRIGPEVTASVVTEKKAGIRWWQWAALAAVVVLILGAVAIWNFYWRAPKIEPASVEKMALPLPQKPSLAILPFDNMSGDPKQEYLSDGITESIILAVSKIPHLFVIARNSTFTYKGKAVKVQRVAEELGVQYVLEGSVQRSEDRIRITAQLIDALSGRHMWSERYDRDLKDLYALQDDITMEIVTAMRVKLTGGEQVSRAKRPHNLKAVLKYYEAVEYIELFTPEANAMAKKLLEEVVAMEPDWGEPYYRLSHAHFMEIYVGTTKSPKVSLDRAIEFSEKAISLDDSLAQALATLGWYYVMKREYDKGIALGEQAIAKDPNGADAHAWLGICLTRAMRAEEAVPILKKAMRLNPFAPNWYYEQLGLSYHMLGRYEDAVAQYKKSLALSHKSIIAHVNLCRGYMDMGKEDEARAAAAEVLRINPKYKADIRRLLYKDRDYCKRSIESLRKAGLK